MCGLQESFFAASLADEQIERWKSQFDIAQLRALRTVSLVLRSMARSLKARLEISPNGKERLGVYIMVDEGEPYPRAISRLLAEPTLDAFDYFRCLPAKYMIGTAASMAAAQVAIETGARGPIHCVLPGRRAMAHLLEQAWLDFENNIVSGCLLGFASSFSEGFADTGNVNPMGGHVASLAYFSKIDAASIEKLRAIWIEHAEKSGELSGKYFI